MKEKLKGMACITLPVVAATAYAMTSFAAETEGTDVMDTAITALTTSVQSMANSLAGAIGTMIPYAIPLVGAGLVVTIGLKVFKSITNKA